MQRGSGSKPSNDSIFDVFLLVQQILSHKVVVLLSIVNPVQIFPLTLGVKVPEWECGLLGVHCTIIVAYLLEVATGTVPGTTSTPLYILERVQMYCITGVPDYSRRDYKM